MLKMMTKGNVVVLRGDGNRPYEDHIGKNDVEGKVDVNDHAYKDHIGKNDAEGKVDGAEGDINDHAYEYHIGKNNDLLNEKDDGQDEQGNGSGCNEEEAMNLNYVVENVTKSVGLIDSQEGLNLVNSEKKKKDEVIHPSLLKGFAEVLVEISKAKKDGEGVVERVGVEVDLDLGKAIKDCSNKNKDGEGKVEKFSSPSFSLGFSQDSQGSKKASQSQSSPERVTKKKIKDRVYLGKPSVGPQCVVPNVDVIDASPVSFVPPLDTLEGPSKPISDQARVINEKSPSKAKSDKSKDINKEGTSEVDVKGKR
ncbi:unnamed protein product [Lactuca virosa]|uniref:Uncharacterized protein n=1 Tax=Lactuca virosa TaxID=75947 RepID=A0AAU9MTI1_9ASTR|nr:unnamed protein product [Lactuca virosa]